MELATPSRSTSDIDFQHYMFHTWLAPLHHRIHEMHAHHFMPHKAPQLSLEAIQALWKHSQQTTTLVDSIVAEVARRRQMLEVRVRAQQEQMQKCLELAAKRQSQVRTLVQRIERIVAKDDTLRQLLGEVTARMRRKFLSLYSRLRL